MKKATLPIYIFNDEESLDKLAKICQKKYGRFSRIKPTKAFHDLCHMTLQRMISTIPNDGCITESLCVSMFVLGWEAALKNIAERPPDA